MTALDKRTSMRDLSKLGSSRSLLTKETVSSRSADPETMCRMQQIEKELTRARRIRDQVARERKELEMHNNERKILSMTKHLKSEVKRLQRRNYELDELLDMMQALVFEIQKQERFEED